MALPTDPKTGQVVFAGANRSGLRNVGSYQVSGHPFVTGSTIGENEQHTISFPYVTKKVTVIASGSITEHIRIHFHASGSENLVGGPGSTVNGTFISLDTHEDSMEFDVKCKELYISTPLAASGGYRVFASLTTIPTSSMFALSGSGVTE
jgi:hypothetical protein